MSINNSSAFSATARGSRGVAMVDPMQGEKARAARKAAKAITKAARKAAAVKRQEEQKAARQRRLDKKLAKQTRKVNRVNKPTVQAVKPATTPVVTQRHIEELRRRDWLRERPSQGHTQAWVDAITPEEEEHTVNEHPVEESYGSYVRNGISWGSFEAQAKEIAATAQEIERKLNAHAKWLRREEGWQQMLVFVKAKYGVDFADLTRDEWESKQLSPERVKSLGLRSPKLSKAMVALGVPQKEVAVLLGANYTKKQLGSAATKILTDKESCWEQGNSVHYSSCQATDRRSQWGGGDSYNRVSEEVHCMGQTLFLWAIGEPMSKDGKGYEARAKLRVMYSDTACKTVAGLYIDRPYGHSSALIERLDELLGWWESWCEEKGMEKAAPVLMPPVWDREDGGGNDFQYMYGGRYSRKLYCPSACHGYQDTLTQGLGGYDCFVDVTARRKSLLLSAYTKRSKLGGVYHNALNEVTFNPQKGNVSAPVVSLPSWRGFVCPVYVELYAYCRQAFGADKFENATDGSGYYFYKGDNRYAILVSNDYGFPYIYQVEDSSHNVIWRDDPYWHVNEVKVDCPELGFYKAVEIPITYSVVAYKYHASRPGEWVDSSTWIYNADVEGWKHPDNGGWTVFRCESWLKSFYGHDCTWVRFDNLTESEVKFDGEHLCRYVAVDVPELGFYKAEPLN